VSISESFPTTRRQFLAATAAATALATPIEAKEGRRIDLFTPYKLGSLVLSGTGKKGDFDEISVDCPFVFSHKNRFHMTYVAFDGTGYQTGLAVSDDLVHWEKKGCILARNPDSPVTKYNIAMNWIVRENDITSAGRLVKVQGEFLGAYHAYPNEGLEQGAAVIGLCRSKDLLHWSIGDPVLLPQDGAEWEHGGLYKPCILKFKDDFHLFYNAKNRTDSGWHEQTGVASSSDLKSWKRYAENPVIPNGPAGNPDSKFASDPCVLHNGNEWALFYFGLDNAGKARDLVATGPDLFHFTKDPKIAIDVGPAGSVDSVYAHKPSVISYKGDLYHFYCAVSKKDGKEVRGISVARSRPWH
jgi:predicted GH43/DUF377 family glycosyl hydrolase